MCCWMLSGVSICEAHRTVEFSALVAVQVLEDSMAHAIN